MELVSFFSSFGVVGLASILFIETAFLPAFFLPGDTLLFTAGYFIQGGELQMYQAIFWLSLAAFLGNMASYFLGLWAGNRIHNYIEKRSKLKDGFAKTHRFYERYGLLTLLIARFVPMVRTVAPFLAGVMKMKIMPFTLISLLGAFVWVSVGLALGSFFGRTVPNMDYIVMGLMIAAFIFAVFPIIFPMVYKIFRKK